MDIISFGDRISTGFYKIHSKFNHAVNFIDNDKMITLVDKIIGSGPVNIVLSNSEFQKISTITAETDKVFLNDTEYECIELLKYSSTLDIPLQASDYLPENIKTAENFLLKFAPAKSLFFLLDEKREADFISGFEIKFISKIKDGVENILSGKLIDGITNIKGTGFGFTPSGDDFIAGMLIAFFVAENIKRKNLFKIRNEIYENSKGGNVISNSFLQLALDGRLPESYKYLIEALMKENNHIETGIKKVLSSGETSGADFLTGFIFTIKNYLKICR